jgi:ribonuclease Z
MAASPTGPTFATPLPQSPRSDILEWRFPKPYHNLTLTGRSRAAWHTSFIIPQLNLLLDAGLCVNKTRPKHIFLTHGHSDHTLLTPSYVKRSDPPDIFCPAEMKDALDAFINAKTILNEGGLWSPSPSPPEGSEESNDTTTTTTKPYIDPKLRSHTTHPLHPGATVALPRLPLTGPSNTTPPWTATAFACDHQVPCLGYIFSFTTHKLRPEYHALPPAELKQLREQQNVSLTAPVTQPVFIFLGDTTARTLATDPAVQTALRQGVKVVVTECSFLLEKHRAQAEKTKHTIWGDLEGVVRQWYVGLLRCLLLYPFLSLLRCPAYRLSLAFAGHRRLLLDVTILNCSLSNPWQNGMM